MTFLKNYRKSILLFCLIFFVSIAYIPVNHLPKIEYQDKIVHFFMYFILSAVIYFDIYRTNILLNNFLLLLFVLVLPIAYGGIIELIQGAFFPPRTADWFDFLTNSLGSLSALLGMTLLFKKSQTK